jgi:hypothetical protein
MKHLRRLTKIAAILAMLVVATTGSAATQAARGQARPVVDAGYLYDQLFQMSTSYIYRVSGADGPPTNPSSPSNLPPTINGWQEFFQHWKGQVTSTRVMGPLARAVSVRDHYFQVAIMPFQSDVAEVTLPGAQCAGQRVLLGSHPDSTPVNGTRLTGQIDQGRLVPDGFQTILRSNLGNGSAYDATSGVAMTLAEFQALLRWYEANGTWPARTLKVALFDAEETGLFGSQFYAANLIPRGPQGQYAMVANMDQNGLEYPARHFGTDHYWNDLVNGGVGPWFTNINASPLQPNRVYNGANFQAIQANMPAILAFRQALQSSVTEAFTVLGARYDNQVPLENPLTLATFAPADPRPRTVPAYTAGDQQRFSPVQDDQIGRTDQVPFLRLGIPGYGVLGGFDANAIENPFPASQTTRPPIPQYTEYDTTRDDIFHLNEWASGMPHGPKGVADPSQELLRALELPATWSTYLAARNDYAGAVPSPQRPVAYFETNPVQPGATTVGFDAGFSTGRDKGEGLTYVWDFGDGTFGTGRTATHRYSGPVWADVKLVVLDRAGRAGAYRQAVDVAGATGQPPATPACGTVTPSEESGVLAGARAAHAMS